MSTQPFRAFISYCHSDRSFAASLHRRLETYRLPKRLASRVEPLPGQARGRIGPVFRDIADLSAADSLPAAVREAIDAASALIVVASPDAARSLWVAREVELFRELHPDRPVLVALVRGPLGEALPPALLADGDEPLAADFRPGGDGRRLAFLKIVAGLTGLPLDALVQRDDQRRLRRVTAVTLGTFVLLLVMTALLVVALRAQAEAQRRRADAEGLVEFMLSDLRERLKGVGNIDVMSTVNARALAYYTAQGDLSRLPDASLERRSRVLLAMGEDDVNRGRLDRASAEFAEAHRSTSAILARHPHDPDAIFAHAQSEFYVGDVAWTRADRATATVHWHAYLDQAKALAAVEPRSVRSEMEQGYAEGNLCDLNLKDHFDLVTAERSCTAAIAHERVALARDPTNRQHVQDLANRYGWLAKVLVELKRYEDGLAARHAEAALMNQLVRLEPANIEYALRGSWSDIGAADILLKTGQPDAALELLEGSRAEHQHLFNLSSEDQRVPQTRLKIYLLEVKALHTLGRDQRSSLAAADAEQARLAGFGNEAASTGQAIRTSLWPKKGRKK